MRLGWKAGSMCTPTGGCGQSSLNRWVGRSVDRSSQPHDSSSSRRPSKRTPKGQQPSHKTPKPSSRSRVRNHRLVTPPTAGGGGGSSGPTPKASAPCGPSVSVWGMERGMLASVKKSGGSRSNNLLGLSAAHDACLPALHDAYTTRAVTQSMESAGGPGPRDRDRVVSLRVACSQAIHGPKRDESTDRSIPSEGVN